MAGKNNKFYVTTSIPYVNASPHIGHALEFVQADVIARYHRLRGDSVFLVTGSDENSLKNVRAAEELKISTEGLVKKNAVLFEELAREINLSFDRFVRTSVKGSDHWKGVYKIWGLCEQSGDLYKKKYTGLYCVGCELFYTKNELVNGLCPEHKTKPELVEEENYFFRLSRYQKALEELIESGALRIIPQSRKNEMLQFVKMGLEDFSVSRSVARSHGWGVPVPGDDSQIMYVWFDALTTYMTGVGFGTNEKLYKEWWPADMHVIGKGIIRFHAIYWPAILMSAKLYLPKNIFVHGYLTIDGEKMSKSLGNVVNPLDLLKRYTADEIRYYLMRDIPTFEDGDFSENALKGRINKELLGDLGNLVNRVLTLVEKSGYSEFTGTKELDSKFDLAAIEKSFDDLELHTALNEIMDFVRACNKYVNDKEPWKQKEDLNQVLYNLLESIRIIAILLYPFVPSTSEKISEKLGFRINNFDECSFRDKFAEKVSKGGYLFKHVE